MSSECGTSSSTKPSVTIVIELDLFLAPGAGDRTAAATTSCFRRQREATAFAIKMRGCRLGSRGPSKGQSSLPCCCKSKVERCLRFKADTSERSDTTARNSVRSSSHRAFDFDSSESLVEAEPPPESELCSIRIESRVWLFRSRSADVVLRSGCGVWGGCPEAKSSQRNLDLRVVTPVSKGATGTLGVIKILLRSTEVHKSNSSQVVTT